MRIEGVRKVIFNDEDKEHLSGAWDILNEISKELKPNSILETDENLFKASNIFEARNLLGDIMESYSIAIKEEE